MGQQLVQAPELQLARGPALAGFASLVVQGWLKSASGGRAKQQKLARRCPSSGKFWTLGYSVALSCWGKKSLNDQTVGYESARLGQYGFGCSIGFRV